MDGGDRKATASANVDIFIDVSRALRQLLRVACLGFTEGQRVSLVTL